MKLSQNKRQRVRFSTVVLLFCEPLRRKQLALIKSLQQLTTYQTTIKIIANGDR